MSLIYEMKLTPDIAKGMMNGSRRNRKVSDENVAFLVEQITGGQWRQNGETIKIDKDGNLLDGQHRCAAVIRSGVPIDVLVAVVEDDLAMESIDQPKIRTFADDLYIRGYKRARPLATTIQCIYTYEKGVVLQERRFKVPKYKLRHVLEERPQITEQVDLVHAEFYGSRNFISLPKVAFLCHYVQQSHPEEFCDFVNGIIHGNNLPAGSPALKFRERMLIAKAKTQSPLTEKTKWALFIVAWNHYIQGNTIGRLKFMSREFPKVLTLY